VGHQNRGSGRFRPVSVDCDQWLDSAVAAGMKYAVLTVKHTGGWCLWDSKHTSHDATAFNIPIARQPRWNPFFRLRDYGSGLALR